MNKSDKKMKYMRCFARCQISEMEDKVYAKFEKAEETRRASCQHAATILDEEEEKVDEMWGLASKNMAEKMADMEEKSTEVI